MELNYRVKFVHDITECERCMTAMRSHTSSYYSKSAKWKYSHLHSSSHSKYVHVLCSHFLFFLFKWDHRKPCCQRSLCLRKETWAPICRRPRQIRAGGRWMLAHVCFSEFQVSCRWAFGAGAWSSSRPPWCCRCGVGSPPGTWGLGDWSGTSIPMNREIQRDKWLCTEVGIIAVA